MENDIHHDSNHNFPPSRARNHGGMGAYLLGMGPMPPLQPQHVAVALTNHMLDNPQAIADDDEDEDENLDPQLPGPVNAQLQAQVADNLIVRARMAVNVKVTRDIEFPYNVPRHNFRDRVMVAMNLNTVTAQLGWKTSDEGKRAPAHQLATDSDIDNAFKVILDIQKNSRRKKGVVLEIIHLNPTAPMVAMKKKKDGNRATNLAYSAELHIIEEKLKCAQHTGPNRWCYASPENPNEHIALGREEITLWACKIHDNDADADCVIPPHCLSLDSLQRKASHTRRNEPRAGIPIHVHINGNPLGDTNRHNLPAEGSASGSAPHGLKRGRSVSSTDSSDSDDEEALTLSNVIEALDDRYPKLNLPQYLPIFDAAGIMYAETLLNCDKVYLGRLGIADGAIHPLMVGVKKNLSREKRERKRLRDYNKEPSVEI